MGFTVGERDWPQPSLQQRQDLLEWEFNGYKIEREYKGKEQSNKTHALLKANPSTQTPFGGQWKRNLVKY